MNADDKGYVRRMLTTYCGIKENSREYVLLVNVFEYIYQTGIVNGSRQIMAAINDAGVK